jgi:carbon-monoxide dehydrogenase small subunit
MASQSEEVQKVTRRNLLKGLGAGVVVGAVAVAGVEEIVRIPALPSGQTSTVTNTVTNTTTTTVTAGAAPAVPVLSKVITLNVNNVPQTMLVPSNWSLLEVLREQLHLFSVKEGCGTGTCGTCTIIIDGKAMNSCQILAVEAEGKKIVTLEGISDYGKNLHPLQTAWMTYHGTQCGYCAPGFIMAAKALLDAKPHPTADEIKEALSGNICICGNYVKTYQAVASVGGV